MNDYSSVEYRYHNDPQFKALVDMLLAHIMNGDFTPSELRTASIVAAVKYESMHMHRYRVTEDVADAIQTLDDWARKGMTKSSATTGE